MENSKDKLVNYYRDNYVSFSLKVKNPDLKFSAMLGDVKDQYLELIYRSLKQKDISFCNCTSFTFSSYFRRINADFRKIENKEPVFHEIGHAVDFIGIREDQKRKRGKRASIYFSSDFVLSVGKTLNEIVSKEVEKKANEIYSFLMKRIKEEVFSFLPEDKIKHFLELNKMYDEEKSLSIRLPLRRYKFGETCPSHSEILKDPLININWQRYFKSKEEASIAYNRRKELLELIGDFKEFNRVCGSIYSHRKYIEFNYKYGTLADMVSGMIKNDGIFIAHSYSYLNRKENLGIEFFAECFSCKMCNNIEGFKIIKEILPKSIKAFEELFLRIQAKVLFGSFAI